MPSPAHETFNLVAERPRAVLRATRLLAPRSVDRPRMYGAAIAGFVAAWQAYAEALVNSFYHETSQFYTGTQTYHYGNANRMAGFQLTKFRTPNSQIVRSLLISTTGYDPWPDWNFPRLQINSFQARSVLDEVIKIRHAIAHGRTLPQVTWAASSTGITPLSATAANFTNRFFTHLVKNTDKGMQRHIQREFSRVPPW